MYLALLAMLFVLTIFGGRLIQLQGINGPAVAAVALAKRTTTITLPAHRGDIVDASGAVMATTVDSPNLLVDQTEVGNYTKVLDGKEVVVGIPGAAQDLSKLLGLPVATIEQRLTGTSRGAVLAAAISPTLATQVLRLPIPGIGLQQASRRVYPDATTAANVLGFVSTADGHAMDGLELAYDKQLAGTAGWLRYEHADDAAQTRIPTGITDELDPQPGRTVQLTLDSDLQYQAQQALAQVVSSSGAESADAVILDAKTGAVLALATAPTFDPNHYASADPADLGDRPLLDAFEPGSTAKVITMAAALEEKVVTPTTPLTVPPQLYRSGTIFHDAEEHGTERLTVTGALAQSSNIGTILTGERLSPATLYSYQRAFGLGRPTGVELAESTGELAPYQQWTGSQRYTLMFGQGMSMTALQAASVYQTIADDGMRIPPRLVAGLRDSDGTFTAAPAPAGTRVISVATARAMRQMMQMVVGDNGTADKAKIPGYLVAGKTGTAQIADHGVYRDGWYTASFIGMAPADNPQLVVAVIVQKPVKGHFGGDIAAPVFQQLMTAALAERKIPPTGTAPAQIPLFWH